VSPPEHRLFQQPWPEGEYRMFQLGFVVADVVEAAGRWASVFGVGPFHVLPSRKVVCRYRGEESDFEMQVAVAQAGPLQIELISQPDDHPSVIRDLFAQGESGLHQLCTVTPGYDAKLAFYRNLGYEVVCELTGGLRVAYVDTTADFGFFTEVVEDAPGFLAQIGAIAETCRTWDGTDPVRLMTRTGYTTPAPMASPPC
jgi:hypothetical protein